MFHECVVAVYKSLDEAKAAVQKLEEAHFRHDQVSLVTHSVRGQIEGDDERTLQFGDNSERNAVKGAGIGGLFGLLLGAPLLAIPGLGAVLLAGPLAAGITGAIVGGFLGSMSGWGVHPNHIREYEQRVRAGAILVVVNGTPQEIAEAQRLLQDTHAEEVVLHAQASDETAEVDDRPNDLMASHRR